MIHTITERNNTEKLVLAYLERNSAATLINENNFEEGKSNTMLKQK